MMNFILFFMKIYKNIYIKYKQNNIFIIINSMILNCGNDCVVMRKITKKTYLKW